MERESFIYFLNEEINLNKDKDTSNQLSLKQNNKIINEFLNNIDNGLNKFDEVDSMNDTYVNLMKLKFEIDIERQKNIDAAKTSETKQDNNTILNLKLLANSYKKSLDPRFFNYSKEMDDFKIQSSQKNAVRNILSAFLIGLFLSVVFVLVRNSRTVKLIN